MPPAQHGPARDLPGQDGEEAVREGLKSVKLKNVKTPEEMSLAFANGVLEMHCAYAPGASGMHSDNVIRELLIKNL